MKTNKIILSFIALLAFCSCDDMFEPAKENYRQKEDMYEEAGYAHGLLMYAYEKLPYLSSSVWDVATDDAVTNHINRGQSLYPYYMMGTSSWASDNENNPMTQWDARKDAIQYVNLFLTIVDNVKWAPSAVSKQQMFTDRLKGEAYALRALQYYYLLQAHGGYADDGVLYGVPLLTQPEDASSDFNQPRAKFSDCVKQMFADCDSASALLPLEYKDLNVGEEHLIPAKYQALGAERGGFNLVLGSGVKNLISKKIVEAIKAQIALLAASPAFREQSGVTSEEAANLCAIVLDRIGGVAGLDPMGNIWYKNKDKIDKGSGDMDEVLWHEVRGEKSTGPEKENFPPTLYGNGTINPSQNLVDAFPTISGLPISDPQSGYDAKDPYVNRDPRLENYVIYNGMIFRKKAIVTGTYEDEESKTFDNIGDNATSTRTGYYLKKLVRDDASPNSSAALPQFHINARIRYTEIFLAYAEAANDAWGPKVPGASGYSAYDVIKAIRQRAGIGVYSDAIGAPSYDHGDPYLEECANDKEKMAQLIRNERRLELCFENKRFWDLRRWKMPLNETIRGIKWTSPTEYEEIPEVEKRVFDSSYQWYGPIPKGEMLKWSNLKQNKGWQ